MYKDHRLRKQRRLSFPKRGRAFTRRKRKKKVGTEPIVIRSVPKKDHRRLWTVFLKGKTGTDQISFTRKNCSEPFHFLSEPFHFFRSCKRPCMYPFCAHACVAQCLFRFLCSWLSFSVFELALVLELEFLSVYLDSCVCA